MKNRAKTRPSHSPASYLEVERAERLFYLDYLREGMLVFDVGANVGELTLMFSRFIGTEGSVHAFEPSTAAFEKLVALCSASSLRNVHLQPIALAEQEQSVVIYSYGDGYLSWTSQALRPLENYGIDVRAVGSETVSATTLDLYCERNGIDEIDLLKVDVEGAELQVLLGARRMLQKQAIRCITFEFGQTTFDMGNSPNDIERYLSELGYDLRNIVNGNAVFPGGESVQTANFAMHVATPCLTQDSSRTTPLHPLTETSHVCPHCQQVLSVVGWYIPGMRTLADLACVACLREFYGDLPSGQGFYTPMLLEKEGAVVHDRYGVRWFADWLRESYCNPTRQPVPFEVHKRLPLTRRVVLLNCLDILYGHSLLKLLNAQYYLDRHVDLIVIVPSFLGWMVPDGVAEVWVVDLPLRRGLEWNDWIGEEIRRRVEVIGAASLSVALSHPRPDEFDIVRFTRITPFPLDQWKSRLNRPTVTFIWRDDRTWSDSTETENTASAYTDRLELQTRLVVTLAEELRRDWPNLDFGVTGLSQANNSHDLPDWIQDLRENSLDAADERRYCERYAKSHVVVGVHGSNMLLPSAHAGALVELLGSDRWGNFTQDILFRDNDDCRDTLFRYRYLPTATPAEEVAKLVSLQLRGYEPFRRLMNIGSDEFNAP